MPTYVIPTLGNTVLHRRIALHALACFFIDTTVATIFVGWVLKLKCNISLSHSWVELLVLCDLCDRVPNEAGDPLKG